jgi:4'-phosphopantetheinyl transferase
MVRWADLDARSPDEYEALLSGDERSRAARLRRGRERFIVARGLMRTLLGEYLGIEPGRVELAYGERGKPRLADGGADLRFNLSHSESLVAFAFCRGREVGIDVEAVRADRSSERLARRYLPPEAVREIEEYPEAERIEAFYRAWVRQEAYAKGRGEGLELIGESPHGWSIVDLDLIGGYAAAVAVEGTAPVRIEASPI